MIEKLFDEDHAYIGCAHGVNTAETFDYLPYWRRALSISNATLGDIRWPSQDNPAFDWLGIRFNPAYRKRCLQAVKNELRAFYLNTRGSPACVVAHSMGAPLCMRAIAELGVHIPLVCIGSPMTHPLLGPRLESAGFGEIPGQRPTAFSNKGDFICALWTPFGNVWRDPLYTNRVEVQIEAEPSREHDAEKYLALPEVRACIEAELKR